MDITHESLRQVIEAASGLGHWTTEVAAFLQRTAALDFIEEFLHETGAPAEEGILTLLASIRFIDRKSGPSADLPTVLDAPPGAVNLDLFLVRHQAELYHLCRSRSLQTNLPERALPVMELLAQRFPSREVAVIEIGSSFGLIGRALCAPDLVQKHFGVLFEAGQQKPRLLPRVAVYRGIDRSPPDAGWTLACIPFSSVRQRTELFIQAFPATPACTVSRGSALDLPEHPAVRELLPRFDQGQAGGLVPVVLTSFLLGRLKPAKRQALTRLVRQFTASLGGAWVNLDFEDEGGATGRGVITRRSRCLAWLDGEARLELDSEYCRSWQPV